jgi:hypothetical protein
MPGGRPAGSSNKNKQALITLLEAKYPGYNPVVEMVAIAQNMDNDLAMRLSAHKEVAQYVTPKLKAVEIETINHQPVQVQIVRYSDTDSVEPRSE